MATPLYWPFEATRGKVHRRRKVGRHHLTNHSIRNTMLKTKQNDHYFLVTQPDHGQLAGTFASHWGNDTFRPLGHYAPVANPSRLRAETVFAIAQHDNGWIEWEAEPILTGSESLPADLSEMVRNQQDGMERWRIGLQRYPDASYANLLISEHPRLLYQVPNQAEPKPEEIHPLYWKERPETLLPGSEHMVTAFLEELEGRQAAWRSRLLKDDETSDWLTPESLKPHVRMLQILDGLSLGFTSSLIAAESGSNIGLGEDAYPLLEVPRTSWSDRITINVQPLGNRRVVLDPYPFDLDPLPVRVPVRVFSSTDASEASFQMRWHSTSPDLLKFQIGSSSSAF